MRSDMCPDEALRGVVQVPVASEIVESDALSPGLKVSVQIPGVSLPGCESLGGVSCS